LALRCFHVLSYGSQSLHVYIAVPAADHEVDVVVVAVERGHEQVEFLLVQEVEVTARLLSEAARTDRH
jgi:hypothetical protein